MLFPKKQIRTIGLSVRICFPAAMALRTISALRCGGLQAAVPLEGGRVFVYIKYPIFSSNLQLEKFKTKQGCHRCTDAHLVIDTRSTSSQPQSSSIFEKPCFIPRLCARSLAFASVREYIPTTSRPASLNLGTSGAGVAKVVQGGVHWQISGHRR